MRGMRGRLRKSHLLHSHFSVELRHDHHQEEYRRDGRCDNAFEEDAGVAVAPKAAEERVDGVARQIAKRDGADIGDDFVDLRVAVVLPKVVDRFRIELVAMFRVMLGKQDRGRFGWVFRLQLRGLMAENLVDLLQGNAMGPWPSGCGPTCSNGSR